MMEPEQFPSLPDFFLLSVIDIINFIAIFYFYCQKDSKLKQGNDGLESVGYKKVHNEITNVVRASCKKQKKYGMDNQ